MEKQYQAMLSRLKVLTARQDVEQTEALSKQIAELQADILIYEMTPPRIYRNGGTFKQT